ncbi:hypothetical protein E1B28_005420 [Marasmius oreades]|uniref:chitin deacetylase n=1 Tax=Marasmius oreades TaxID=181124 RepID=A0A9P7UUT1_9AGAR|nr:uncharacterized protein E1B28_005420 [Marasmius oreades]KAG7094595.1 hypothetical protein E1B28_005420 [Marasmius oreades]
MDRRPSFRKAVLLALLAQAVLSSPVLGQDGNDGSPDPSTECTAYTLPLVQSNLGSFPAIGKQASIVANDTVAKSKWTEISGKVLGTEPKPAMGSTTGYSTSDPDCWWTYGQCTTPKAAGLTPDVVDVPEPSTMGYGFDDGPYCNHNGFYDFLKSSNQKATMYFIGSNVIQWPKEAQRALTDGHELCVRTFNP